MGTAIIRISWELNGTLFKWRPHRIGRLRGVLPPGVDAMRSGSRRVRCAQSMLSFDWSAVQRTVRTLHRTRLVRTVAHPAFRVVTRLQGGAPPRVLANSIPKSGTYLLTALLGPQPDMRFSGHHLTAYDFAQPGQIKWSDARRQLARIRDEQYVSCHLPAAPELIDLLAELGYRSLNSIRDARDAAVSDLHYVASYRQHPLHKALTALPEGDRTGAVISGMPGHGRGVPLLEPMPQRLDDYRGWMDGPATRTVRFQALVGSPGGGSDEVQTAEIRAIAEHVGWRVSEAQARTLAARVWSPNSSTFLQGWIDGWKLQFTEPDTALVKRLTGDRITSLGYEKNDD